MTVVAGVADKVLAGERYHVGQANTSLTPIFPLMMTYACTLKPLPGTMPRIRSHRARVKLSVKKQQGEEL